MTARERTIAMISEFTDRIRWWYAKWRGERPTCGQCGADAIWYATDVGYTCIMCEEPRKDHIALVRDLQPSDYFDTENEQ